MYTDTNPIHLALGEHRFNQLPNLDIGDMMGATGYIDILVPDDMVHSVMKGVDIFKRPFIAFKLTATKEDDTFDFVGTFFQRYTDNSYEWAYGTCSHSNLLFHDSRVRHTHFDDLEHRIRLLLSQISVTSIDSTKHIVDYIRGNGAYTIALCSILGH
jgi:hypothetical protein